MKAVCVNSHCSWIKSQLTVPIRKTSGLAHVARRSERDDLIHCFRELFGSRNPFGSSSCMASQGRRPKLVGNRQRSSIAGSTTSVGLLLTTATMVLFASCEAWRLRVKLSLQNRRFPTRLRINRGKNQGPPRVRPPILISSPFPIRRKGVLVRRPHSRALLRFGRRPWLGLPVFANVADTKGSRRFQGQSTSRHITLSRCVMVVQTLNGMSLQFVPTIIVGRTMGRIVM